MTLDMLDCQCSTLDIGLSLGSDSKNVNYNLGQSSVVGGRLLVLQFYSIKANISAL